MNLAHIHLLLNHFPTVGFIVGVGLLALSVVAKSMDLKRASLIVILGIALITIPTYVTGNAAAQAIENSPGVSKEIIHAHESGAMWALGLMELTGAIAWLGLWQYRRKTTISNTIVAVTLLLGFLTFAVASSASTDGGLIRHPEILEAGQKPPVNNMAREVGLFVTGARWMWPTCESLHFVGLSLLLGVVFFIDLRMLGIMKNVSFPALHRILPWAILGFGINVATGMLFFIGAPEQYTDNTTFYWKLALVLIAGVNAMYFTIFDAPWKIKAGDDAPFTVKAVAVSAMVLWIGVMYCGTMLPFLGNAF